MYVSAIFKVIAFQFWYATQMRRQVRSWICAHNTTRETEIYKQTLKDK